MIIKLDIVIRTRRGKFERTKIRIKISNWIGIDGSITCPQIVKIGGSKNPLFYEKSFRLINIVECGSHVYTVATVVQSPIGMAPFSKIVTLSPLLVAKVVVPEMSTSTDETYFTPATFDAIVFK